MSKQETNFQPLFKPAHWGHTSGHLFLQPIGSPMDDMVRDEARGRIIGLIKGNASVVIFLNAGHEFTDHEDIVDLRDLPSDMGLPLVEEIVSILNEHDITPVIDDGLDLGD